MRKLIIALALLACIRARGQTVHPPDGTCLFSYVNITYTDPVNQFTDLQFKLTTSIYDLGDSVNGAILYVDIYKLDKTKQLSSSFKITGVAYYNYTQNKNDPGYFPRFIQAQQAALGKTVTFQS